jgi:hypothetical protein
LQYQGRNASHDRVYARRLLKLAHCILGLISTGRSAYQFGPRIYCTMLAPTKTTPAIGRVVNCRQPTVVDSDEHSKIKTEIIDIVAKIKNEMRVSI